MSAFGGNTMQFGLRIGATDDTRGGLRSALASVQGFMRSAVKPIQIPISIARGGLGLLRDINLGLAPLVRGLDAIIERGSSVEVQQKTFRSLTQATARDADRMASSIVKASSGTLTMARGMQIANRALASGMNLDQVKAAVEFISKFSVAVGKEPGEALNTVITGLARGSTLFLDDFGILVNGVDQVKQDFDAIKGSGAFDSLGPAAQKAEIVRRAIAEMEQRTKSLGISGRESIFVWQAIKNQVNDATDGIVTAISKSGALKAALTGMRDVLSGINEHFKAGGTFGEMLFGKGESGGLLGLAKGALVDAGSALGRGILGAILKGIGAMPEIGEQIWSELEDAWTWAMGELRTTLGAAVDDAMNAVETRFFPRAAAMQQFEGMGASNPVARMMSLFFSQGNPQTGTVTPGIDDPVGFAAVGMFNLLDRLGFVKKGPAPTTQPARPATPGNWFRPLYSPERMRLPTSFFDHMSAAGDRVLSGGVYGGDSAFMKEVDAFRRVFPGTWNQPGTTPETSPIGRYRLTAGARDSRMNRLRVLEAQLRNIESGGNFARQHALKESGAQIRDLLRRGYHLTPGDRRELFEQALERQIAARRSAVQEEIDQIRGEVSASDERRRFEADHTRMRNAARQTGAGEAEMVAAVRAIGAKVDQFVSGVSAVIQKLTGVEVTLANAQGRAA